MTDIKNGTCPKCGSNEIYTNNQRRGRGNYIAVKLGFGAKYIRICHYACASCSYIESYIADPDSIKSIVENWQPLNKEKRKNEG